MNNKDYAEGWKQGVLEARQFVVDFAKPHEGGLLDLLKDMSENPRSNCDLDVRPLPWKPFSAEPVNNPRGKLYRERETPALQCVMAVVEERIAVAAGGLDESSHDKLLKASGAFTELMELYQELKDCAEGKHATALEKEKAEN